MRAFLALLILLTLPACAAQVSGYDPATAAALQTQFQSGDAAMTCGISCSMSYGTARPELEYLYDTQDWAGLSTKLLDLGYNNDQSWFYLGRAAEGLGYTAAARKYYTQALAAGVKCAGFMNVCDGVDVPLLAQTRLAALSPAPTQDSGFDAAPAPAVDAAADSGATNEIPLTQEGGDLTVPVLINGVIPLKFVLDSGSSDVSIPADVALTLYRTGTLQDSDFTGTQTYTLADGSTVPSDTFIIRSLKLGNVTVTNIPASVADASAPLLLGQTFLKRFKSWSIDNSREVLILQ